MPLTFAHPAAALPLAGRRLPLAALMVGSMAPDLLYFLRMSATGRFGHTLPGLFLFCLPVGMAVLWIIDRVVWEPVVDLAPDGLRERLAARPRPDLWKRPALPAAGIGIVVGAITHVVWDAFTHDGTWATRRLPVLLHEMNVGLAEPVAVYKILQHASTVFGLAVLAIAAAAWWRSAPRVRVPPGLPTASRVARLALLLGVAATAGTTRGWIRLGISSSYADMLGSTVVVTTAVAFWLAVIYSLAIRHRAASRA